MRMCFFNLILLAGLSAAALAVPADTVTVIAVGDCMFGTNVTDLLDNNGVDYPFRGVKDILSNADARVCNLEAPLADSGTPFNKTYTFRIATRHAAAFKAFDVAHLANNHILDNGENALFSTFRVLDSLGIRHIGAGRNAAEARKPAILERKGVKIGFLGYSLTFPEEFWAASGKSGTAFGHDFYLKEDIPAAKKQCDYLVVVFHWGVEKSLGLRDYQKEMGYLAVDLGADAVVGHHPHILQGMELYKGKLIAYSLGNFAFATWTHAVWDSAILKLFFANGKFLKAEVTPVLVNNYQVTVQPRPLTGADAEKSLRGLAALCDSLKTPLVVRNGRGEITP
ncbi:MAG: CapA family protein [Fibrobacterota bacterium]